MFKGSLFLVLFNLCLSRCLSYDSFLTDEDKSRLKSLFKLDSKLAGYNLSNIFYSIKGSSILANNNLNSVFTTNEINYLCNHFKATLAGSKYVLEDIFFASASSQLLNCQIKPNPKVFNFLQNLLDQDPTVVTLYRATICLQNFGQVLDSKKISKALQTALKKDENLLNVGLAFHLASKFKEIEHMAPFVDRLGDILVQADEINGKFLQFEGGLGVTSRVIHGIYSLASASNKTTGLTADQAVKFSNYFLNRKSVQTQKGGAELLILLEMFTKNKFHIPVCVSVYGSSSVSKEKPILTIKVTNVMGKSLGTGFSVLIESESFSSKKTLNAVQGDSTLFALNMLETQVKPGPHNLSISVYQTKTDFPWVGHLNNQVKVILMTKVLVQDLQIGVRDEDHSLLKMVPLTYPKSHQKVFDIDYQQKLLIQFSLKDATSSEFMRPHQVFIQLLNSETDQEIIYVIETESSNGNVYKFDFNTAFRAKDFGHTSGLYHISLMCGDAIISNPFVWKLASARITFPSEEAKTNTMFSKAPWMTTHYSPKPVINHLFREKEKRPPTLLSDTFTVLVTLPLFILLIFWFKLGANFYYFSFTLSSILFHLGLGSIFTLFILFWFKLNMFTTIKYLLALGLVTFLTGHRTLRNLASIKESKTN